MSDRELILGRVRASLEQTRGVLQAESDKAPPPHPRGPFMRSDLAAVEQFTAELEALAGHVHRCASEATALEKLRSLLESHEVESVLHWDPAELPLSGVGEVLSALEIQSAEGQVLGAPDRVERIQALESVPLSLSGADAAIAESGSIVVVSGPGRGRLASLLAPIHIALLPAERIVRTLPDAFELLYRQFGPHVAYERANITVITGPSRSADIEQSLTLGVHGPKEIHVIVFGNTQEQANAP